MTDVAYAAGFASLRSFNATVPEVFALTPTELRRRRAGGGARGGAGTGEGVAGRGRVSAGTTWRCACRSGGHCTPTACSGTSSETRVPGVEEWRGGAYRRALRLRTARASSP